MYDKLINRLRGATGWKNASEHYSLMREAADAIRELSKYANTMRRLKCEGWYLQQNKYHDGYQAVATMPLPEPPKKETE